jgi:cysteine desulfurase
MIYLDYAASTPVDPRVAAAMQPWLAGLASAANPASDHPLGRQARAAVEEARADVAALTRAQPDEVIWTSGATEANNLALKGAVEFHVPAGRPVHIVTARTEHKAVLDACKALEVRDVAVTYLTPDASGRVEVASVLAAIRPETLLVSLMWVNNEIGVVQPIEALAAQLRARGVLFHVDAAQAAGRVPIDWSHGNIDLLTLSAHKLYGPKGIGALVVRRRPRARLAPQMHGGGHEWGMRSGTLATHQIVGMGVACRLAREEGLAEAPGIAALRDHLAARLEALPGVRFNGHRQARAAHILNLSFEGVEGESLRAGLPGLAVSSGAACSAATQEPSYVLRALGRSDELAGASLRFSLGRFSSAEEVDAAADAVIAQVGRLRALSPLEQAA